MEIINLTPHTIIVICEAENGQIIHGEFKPSGQVARVKAEQRVVDVIDGIPVVKTEFAEIEGLPGPEAGKIYLVSSLVAQAASGRSDVVAPDTGPSAYRDEEGKIVAVRRFQQF